MIEKNIKREKAKKYRIQFDGRFCTIDHKSKKHPDREMVKRQIKREMSSY